MTDHVELQGNCSFSLYFSSFTGFPRKAVKIVGISRVALAAKMSFSCAHLCRRRLVVRTNTVSSASLRKFPCLQCQLVTCCPVE